ncbi:MAG: DEDD exonuclease domain-containing protein [Ilumatobacteraceae bacterium]|nr:DEDD exonuclease domain-containing protein [Ilumatobacteraceae bacterium]
MFVLNCTVVQRTFDDLGTPLCDVTFCVLDIETTGGDRGADTITEIGAIKVRGGECLGTFGTLVNPGRAIAPAVVLLTGITDHMVTAAPRAEAVLPSLLEFVGDAVIVGHNVGFDVGFLNTALRRAGHQPFRNTVVDTLPLARRLVRDEVPDCRLGTLASRFRLGHRPTHRALDDAMATADLLHLLLERAAGLGVLGLDDLVALPSIGGHAQAGKLRLTDPLPRSPGVYRFLDGRGDVLYVGKATNLRQRVRSYFSSDDRRKVGALLRETQRIAHTVTHHPITAEVLELRYLHRLNPRYNRANTTWQKYCYVRLTTDEAWPRLVITNEPAAAGVHLGPLGSRAAAQAVIEAVQTALPIRRCTTRIGRNFRPTPGASPCRAAQLGVAMCPCTGEADEAAYWRIVAQVMAALSTSPEIVLAPLWQRLEKLAVAQRYEEAALTRDRANAFANAVTRQRLMDQLRAAGDVEVRLHDTILHVRHGVLVDACDEGQLPTGLELPAPDAPPYPAPLPRDAADEVLCLARALEKASFHARLLSCTGEWAQPAAPVPEITRLDILPALAA